MTKIKLDKPKKIIFLRHGHSLGIIESKVTADSQRPLSDRGMEEVRISAQKLAQLKINFDIIISSTNYRAEQTAKILSDALNIKILAAEELCGTLTPAVIWQFLVSKLKNFDNVIIAGHQPYLGIISGELLYGAAVHISAADFIAMEFNEYLPMEIEHGFAKEIRYPPPLIKGD
jgi:phosphohistidine phosphatase SixA